MSTTHTDDLFAEAVLAAEIRDARHPWENTSSTARVNEMKEDRAGVKSKEVGAIRVRLAATASSNLTKAADKIIKAGDRPMSDEDYGQFIHSVNIATRAAETDRTLGELEERFANQGAIRVQKEARVYDEGSPNSWYADVAALRTQVGGISPADPYGSAAAGRMEQYARELTYEVNQRSAEGVRAERTIREHLRSDDVSFGNESRADRQVREVRALTTGGGATASASGGGGAALVSPFFCWTSWAPFRGANRTFADQCATEDLPPYGMQVVLPAFTSATSTTTQTEGSPVTETDPSSGFQTAQLQTVTGQITMSQQLHDRGYTGGGSFDKAMQRQLMEQLEQSVETYTLAQALGGAATVTGQSSFSIANLYQDIASGREKLTDTAGVRLRPTHFFTTSDLFSYVSRQVDNQQRPIVEPQFVPGFPLAQGDATTKWSRFTGVILPGSLLWFTSDQIPNLGTTAETQLIISAPDQAMVLFEGDPVLTVFPQPGVANLEVILNLRCYCAAVARYPSGTASIAGAAYTASLI